MDRERSNIFDCFGTGDDLTYTELQPVRVNSSSRDAPVIPLLTGAATDSNASIPLRSNEDQSVDDSFYPELEADNEDSDDEYSYVQQFNWIPDDDLSENEGNVQSSDESSDDDDYPDILDESDPEPERYTNSVEDNAQESMSLPPSCNVEMSKNGSVVGSKEPIPQVGRTPTRNVFRPPKSNVRQPQSVNSIVSAFHLIFTERIINDIVKMTNKEGVRIKGTRWKPVDFMEMRALFGLYIHLGARKLSLLSVSKIWYGATADNVALCSMSMKRFVELSTILRFDDKETRTSRRNKDIFAPLRDLFNEVNKNLQRHYIPSQSLTVDEQLMPWRGRCKFLQYLPSKPDKYGLKLFLMCDSETAYPLQGIPYLGKHGERKTNLGKETVKELASPYHKTGRNITCDNFFTDLELANHLSKKGLSVIGTVRKNKAFLPQSFQTGKDIKKFESKFLFREEESMVAYKSNDKKHVIVLSTMHHSADVDTEGKKKPVMVQYYNKTKGGVDTFDDMCHSFSTKRKTRRWPMVLLYNLLDTAVVAAHIIYKKVFPADTQSYRDRGRFNELLAKELILDHLLRRMKLAKTTPRIKLSFEILKMEWKISTEEQAATRVGGQRKRKAAQGRCQRCPRKKDRKVKQVCSKCDIFVCNDHSTLVCNVCG